jgi:hypothetical protein
MRAKFAEQNGSWIGNGVQIFRANTMWMGASSKESKETYTVHFLIQHVNPATLDEISDDECERFFDGFVALHDQEIE